MKTFFQLSNKEDETDSAGGLGLNDLVFNEENQERRSWKLCNSRLPRSEAVYFTQIIIIMFLIDVSLIKLVFFHLDCEVLDCDFGFRCFHAQLATRFLIRSYEQDNFNKRSTIHGSFWAVMLW